MAPQLHSLLLHFHILNNLCNHFSIAFVPSIPKGFALGSDVDFAKECAKVVHYYRFVTEQIDRMFKLMHQAALCYRYVLYHCHSAITRE